jgi:hypothetical protein
VEKIMLKTRSITIRSVNLSMRSAKSTTTVALDSARKRRLKKQPRLIPKMLSQNKVTPSVTPNFKS